jgi:hypothetical protein
MMSLDMNEETVHNHSSNQPGSVENSHSLSVQHEIVARDQQYETIVDTGYEHLITQYETVHNSTFEHIGEVVIQVTQLKGRPTADRLVNNVDDDGRWQILGEQATQVNLVEGRPTAGCLVYNVDDDGYLRVLNDKQNAALDTERYLQVLNNDNFALSERPGGYNQRVRRAARVDSYGYLQPVVKNDAEVHALSLVSLNSNDFTANASDTSCNRSHPQYAASNDTTPNPLYTLPDDTPPNPLYTTPDDTPSDPLYTAPDDTPPTTLYAVHNHENRPRLPTPRVNSQLMSNTTSVNLKLPVRPHSFKQLLIWLYCCKKYFYGFMILTAVWQKFINKLLFAKFYC